MEVFTFGKIGKQDLNLGRGTFNATLPDGTNATLDKIGLHTFSEVLNVKDFGAVGDGVNDDTAAIQAAFDEAYALGWTVRIPKGIYIISSTLSLYKGLQVYGDGFGSFSGQDHPTHGTILKWSGAPNDDIVYGTGMQMTRWENITIDGDHVANCRGFVIDSDNAPISRMVYLRNVGFVNIGVSGTDGVGIQIGTVTGIGTQYQSDGMIIEGFWIYGCTTGIRIASQNSMQYSSIRNGFIGSVNKGIDFVRAGGVIEISQVAGGTWTGTDPAFIYVHGPTGPITLRNVQMEIGGALPGYGFWVTAGLGNGGSYLYPYTFIGCVFDQPVVIDANVLINAIGSSFSSDVNLNATDVVWNAIESPMIAPAVIVKAFASSMVTEKKIGDMTIAQWLGINSGYGIKVNGLPRVVFTKDGLAFTGDANTDISMVLGALSGGMGIHATNRMLVGTGSNIPIDYLTNGIVQWTMDQVGNLLAGSHTGTIKVANGTAAQMAAITAQVGMIFYNTDDAKFYGYNGAWIVLGP
jgi:hypothetical protein